MSARGALSLELDARVGVDLPDTWEIENQTGFAKGVTQTKWKPVVNID